jgi:hypothetical protein
MWLFENWQESRGEESVQPMRAVVPIVVSLAWPSIQRLTDAGVQEGECPSW